MEIKRLSTGARLTVGGVTLLPLIETWAGCRAARQAAIGYGTRIPVGVIVATPGSKYVLNLTGETVPLEPYRGLPDVEKLLNEH